MNYVIVAIQEELKRIDHELNFYASKFKHRKKVNVLIIESKLITNILTRANMIKTMNEG